jgi:hypothetical protein
VSRDWERLLKDLERASRLQRRQFLRVLLASGVTAGGSERTGRLSPAGDSDGCPSWADAGRSADASARGRSPQSRWIRQS